MPGVQAPSEKPPTTAAAREERVPKAPEQTVTIEAAVVPAEVVGAD